MTLDRVRMSTAAIGVAVAAGFFTVLRLSGVINAEEVWFAADGVTFARIAYAMSLAACGASVLVLSAVVGNRLSKRMGAAGYIGALSAGVHLVAWCAVGVSVGAQSASGTYGGLTWAAILGVLAVSAVVFLGVCFGAIRSPASTTNDPRELPVIGRTN